MRRGRGEERRGIEEKNESLDGRKRRESLLRWMKGEKEKDGKKDSRTRNRDEGRGRGREKKSMRL